MTAVLVGELELPTQSGNPNDQIQCLKAAGR